MLCEAEPNSQPKDEIQRIYIGGIQPPTLTVEMVQKRLQSTLANKVEFLSFDTNKSFANCWGEDTQTFFFLTAKSIMKRKRTSTKSSTSTSTSTSPVDGGKQEQEQDQEFVVPPIDIISKQYNNVKWKGCTLRAEKAKLHFLDKLEVEREEEKVRKLEKKRREEDLKLELVKEAKVETEVEIDQEVKVSNQIKTNSDTSTDKAPKVRKTKRHLRIRKRFGEEAYVVDTKPVETNTQTDLHYALKKQREKRTKHLDLLIESRRKRKSQGEEVEQLRMNDANFSLQSKSYLNRAIHIHFNEENRESNIIYTAAKSTIPSIRERGAQKNIPGRDSSGIDSDDGSSVPSSSDDEEVVSPSRSDRDHEETHGAPVESEDESSIANQDTTKKDVETKPSENSGSLTDSNGAKGSIEFDDDDSPGSGYVWSDSDDDSTSSHSENQITKYFDYSESKHDDLDEFASSFQENTVTSWKYGEEDFACEDDASFTDEFFSLDEDVRSNLNVVGKLFPELSRALPESFNADGNQAKPEAPAGWDAFGMMQRYDPSASSANGYEVKVDAPSSASIDDGPQKGDADKVILQDSSSEYSTSDEDSDKEDYDDGIDGESKDDESDQQKINETNDAKDENRPKNDIYEEKKLENIFQQERSGDGTTGFQMSSLFDKSVAGVQSPHATNSNEVDSGLKGEDEAKNQIYEEKKLENIFQQKRSGDGTTGFQMSSLFDQKEISNAQSRDDAFSFSFQTKTLLEKDVEAPILDTNKNTSILKIEEKIPESSGPHPSPPNDSLKAERQWCGPMFNEEELNVYIDKFYNMNEGIDAVMASMEDPSKTMDEDQNNWDEERKYLTLDWKQKQKQAHGQKKKRMKYR